MKRRPLLILFCLLVAGGGLFVWKSSRAAQADSFVMVDGSRITFQGITVGTNHSYCFGNPLQRLAARIPGRLGQILHGGTVFRFPTGSVTNAIFWFRQREDFSHTNVSLIATASGTYPRVHYRIKLRDDNGNSLASGTGRSGATFPSGEFALFVHSTNLPASSRTIRVRLESWYGPSDWRKTAEFSAPNPLFRKQP